MSRRKLASCATFALLLAPCPGAAEQAATLADHVLARTAYGPDAWSRQRIETLGVDAYLEEQLQPAAIPDDALEARLAAYPSLELEFVDLRDAYHDRLAVPLREATHARLLRSALSHRQLEQMLVDFWFDHFNVYALDGFVLFAVAPYELRAIRPHVLGRFEDLLVAVARSAAMLHYLDNTVSTREGFVALGVTRGLNENFARELLELHTVGVDAGYSQRDVIEVARAFTGWMVAEPPYSGFDGFYFSSAAHDEGEKRVMQLFLRPSGGIVDGVDVIAYLASHPRTAKQVCTRLIERFVSEVAPVRLVDACSATYLASDGDLRAVTRTILFSPEFRAAELRGSKLKRPLVFAISFVRALGLELGEAQLDALLRSLDSLGEAPYRAHSPIGYPDRSSYWASGGALLARLSLVSQVCDAKAWPGTDWGVPAATAAEIVDGLVWRLLSGHVAATTRQAVLTRVEALGAAPYLTRVCEAATLLLASPEFARH